MLGKHDRSNDEQLHSLPDDRLDANIKRKTRLIKRLKHDAAIKILGFMAALYVTFTFIFGITLAPANDMYPAIRKGDLVIYYRPGRLVCTDIVIYESPDGRRQIGRIEGTAGDTAGRTEGGLLTINNRIQPVQKRAGIYEETYAGTKNIDGEIKDGQYLILGDSREKAADSRTFGLIPGKSIKGKVFTIIRRRPL